MNMTGSKRISRIVLALITALVIELPAGSAIAGNAAHADASLYQALGGKAGITAIVDTLLNNVADDTRIVHYFADVNIRHVHHGLITMFCMVSGGPCTYTGESMADTHRGLHVTAAAYNAMVEDLQAAMAQLKVPLAAQNGLLAQLAAMRNQIVEPAQRD